MVPASVESAAFVHGGSTLTLGQLSLLVFLMVVVARVQEVVPTLAPLRIGLIAGSIAALSWLLAPVTMHKKVPLGRVEVRYVLGLFGLAIASIPISIWPGHSLEFVISAYWKLILLFLLVLYWSRSIRDIRRIVWVCCLGVMTFVIVGLFVGDIYHERFQTDSQTYDRNDLALVLVMALPLKVYLLSTSRGAGKLVAAGMMLCALVGIMLTQSRGGFLALIVVITMILWRSAMSRASKAAVVVVFLVTFAGLAGEAYWDRMQTMWEPSTEYDQTAGGRTEVWKNGIKILAMHPWGIGIDGFETAEGLSHSGKGKWNASHNSFLQIGCDLGIAGLFLFIALLWRCMRGLSRVQAWGLESALLGAEASEKQYGCNAPLGKRDVASLAASLEISLLGFVCGGFFLSQAYNPFLYVLLALSIAVSRLSEVSRMAQGERGL